MRKLVIALLTLILIGVAAGGLWIFKGPKISLFIDRFGMTEIKSNQITTVRYEGNGTGGVLHVNDVALSLNRVGPPLQQPSVGSTKDGKLGLAVGGKVFPLGQQPKNADDTDAGLTAAPDQGDDARIIIGHSKMSWPTPFSLNFMTGASPSWKRYSYQRLTWNKSDGKKLRMLWRYEQHFDRANGWTSSTMIGQDSPGLVTIEIEP